VDLNEPATSNTPVTLSASDGITVPAGTTVLQGQTSATFPITASATAPEWSVITATANGQPLSAVAQVLTGAFVMRATPFSLTLYFRNPTPNKSVVSFTDSNPFRYYGADATRISRRSTPAFEAWLKSMSSDATIKLFSPGTNPDAIPAKRAYRRTRYFAHNELSRLTQDALRTASGPLTAAQIAAIIMHAKGMPSDDAAFKGIVAERVLTVLRRLTKRGALVKSGASRNAQWVLPIT
jgi:hypothetical protein